MTATGKPIMCNDCWQYSDELVHCRMCLKMLCPECTHKTVRAGEHLELCSMCRGMIKSDEELEQEPLPPKVED